MVVSGHGRFPHRQRLNRSSANFLRRQIPLACPPGLLKLRACLLPRLVQS
ncbi:MAG: hypothetical protein HF973_19240 [Chloroflexi bacterium]|nr:hypothetical protein [Chloroflexota bacterium]